MDHGGRCLSLSRWTSRATDGVLVHQSELLQNNSVVVQGRAGVLLVDPGGSRLGWLKQASNSPTENLRLAARIAESFPRLDVQVNNVGAGPGSRQLTRDGYETILALNFVAPSTAVRGTYFVHLRIPCRLVGCVWGGAWG